jgi:hypothetical protein
MTLFLQVLGVFALVTGGILLIAAIYIAIKWRALKKLISASPVPTPSKITLEPVTDTEWTNASPAREAIAELLDLGFQRGGVHAIPEMPGVELADFFDPSGRVCGVIYLHPSCGCFTDLCVDFEDGFELTVSNAAYGSELETRPETEKRFHPGATPKELFAIITEEMKRGPSRQHGPGDFRDWFVTAYQTDMEWRNSKGGLSEQEIRRIADNSGFRLTGSGLEEALKESRLDDIRRWNAECIEEFSSKTTLSVNEWKQVENSLLILRDDFHPAAYLAFIDQSFDLDPAEIEELSTMIEAGADARLILQTLSESTKISTRLMGEVARPITAEIHHFAKVA